MPTQDSASETTTLDGAIHDHVRTYALWHGWPRAARHFGVSRHILWRFLERGRLTRSLPGAVIKTAGDDPGAIAVAAWAVSASRRIQRQGAYSGPLVATQGGHAGVPVSRVGNDSCPLTAAVSD